MGIHLNFYACMYRKGNSTRKGKKKHRFHSYPNPLIIQDKKHKIPPSSPTPYTKSKQTTALSASLVGDPTSHERASCRNRTAH